VDDDLDRLRAAVADLGADPAAIATATEDELGDLAVEQRLWGGPPELTVGDVARAVGLDGETVRRLWMRLGVPDPGDRPAFHPQDVTTFRLGKAGIELFGPDAIERFSLLIGMSVRRITEAATTLLEERQAQDPDASTDEAWTRAGVATELLRTVAAEMLPTVMLHSVEQTRDFGSLVRVEGGDRVCVTFCDLAGSTALLNAPDPRPMLNAISAFEIAAGRIVVDHRGVVVKFVGDEVMFTTAVAADAIAAGRALLTWVADQTVLGTARAGIAIGPVQARAGDYFGPTVNRAARLVAQADPGTLLVDAELVDDGPEIRIEVRGFPEPVRARALS
jgi:class 3 adenylate cyclase